MGADFLCISSVFALLKSYAVLKFVLIVKFGYCRKAAVYFFVTRAVCVVVVDYAASLQMRIDCYGSQIFKALAFQVLADPC